MEKQVAETLIRLGFQPHLTGYKYALAGVCMIMRQPDVHLSLTKAIYPDVGEMYGVKSNQVERAIRGSLEQLVDDPTGGMAAVCGSLSQEQLAACGVGIIYPGGDDAAQDDGSGGLEHAQKAVYQRV